ncbi:MAG: hypothetical protein M0P70_17185 [Desulfobulbaceae bacterium]|nr:hypothetical protein [Desulfobulbaceae bacterium]
MTKQVKLLLYGIFFLLLLTALAMIVGKRYSVSGLSPDKEATVASQPKMEPAQIDPQPGTAVPQQAPPSAVSQQSQVRTAVPQAQLDLVTKREEARQRRDEMLKMRAETIKKLGPGNTGEPQPEQ